MRAEMSVSVIMAGVLAESARQGKSAYPAPSLLVR
jgi:hypothetical protein